MSELLELAERCEQATGPDRNLDYQLDYVRCNWPVIPAAPDEKEWAELAEADDLPPAYTASLDAAISLVPEECFPLLDWRGCHCRMRTKAGDDIDGLTALASTPALALCGAALRARATTKGEGDKPSNTQEIEP